MSERHKACDRHLENPIAIYCQCVGCEIEGLRKTAALAHAFVNAKGRYHSQQAMCDLLEHFDKPCVRPDKQGDKPYHESEIPKLWELYRHKNGTLYRVALVANQNSDRPEYPIIVSYTDDDGNTWAKTLSEFLSKMTRVSEQEQHGEEG